MTKLIDIYKAVNELLSEKYPEIKIYGKEVKEEFDRPAFFVSFKPVIIENQSVNFRYKKYDIEIVYFQKNIDEIDNMEKVDELTALFGKVIKVNDSYIHVLDFDHEYIGEDDDILQITFNIDFIDWIQKQEEHEFIEEIVMQGGK